jgi:hypothetical protein
VAVRLQFIPRKEPPDLLDLPWATPLEAWEHPRLVRMAKGPSRHVVRFVSDGDRVYALKETTPGEAQHEYGMLRLLASENLPVVEAVGLITGRQAADGAPLDAVLVTRYLDYALPFRYLFSVEGGHGLGHKLVDAAVVLVVRLHMEGFYWGDCSLANLLFRRDAGALMAYLVDAETAEHHRPLPEGMRQADVDLARENVAGGLLDLEGQGLLSPDVEVFGLADLLQERYNQLWDELTASLEVDMGERHLIEGRLRRLNDMGFDVGELIVEQEAGGHRLRVTPALVEEGHHSRELRRLTGLEVQENQARRLLNDIAAFGAYLARVEGRPVPHAVVAARWMAEVYEPLVAEIPAELVGRREPAELFHELLEHRYYLSEAAGREVDNQTAIRSYIDTVLRFRPPERVIFDDQGHSIFDDGRPPGGLDDEV